MPEAIGLAGSWGIRPVLDIISATQAENTGLFQWNRLRVTRDRLWEGDSPIKTE
ncbi:MAG: hypothetical protein ACI87O_000279 [Planctomycetota bacterium]|jgi:hypothetical protein